MNSKEFHENALKTEGIPTEIALTYEALVAAMRIAVEAGNAVDVIKKAMYYGKPIDGDKFADTLRNLSEASVAMRLLAVGGLYSPKPMPIYDEEHIRDVRILHGTLGMITEAGEMANALLNYANGDVFDMVNFREELGDSDWYKAILHDALEVPEEDIRAVVIAKLKKRYGDKFSTEAAINRDLSAERETLEGNSVTLEVQDGMMMGTAEFAQ